MVASTEAAVDPGTTKALLSGRYATDTTTTTTGAGASSSNNIVDVEMLLHNVASTSSSDDYDSPVTTVNSPLSSAGSQLSSSPRQQQHHHLEPCLSAACSHVERLLEQIVSKDAPPINEEQEIVVAVSAVNKEDDKDPSSEEDAALMTSPTTEIAGASSFETDASSLGLTTFQQDYGGGGGGPLGVSNTTSSKEERDNKNSGSSSNSNSSPTAAAATRMGHAPLLALCSWTLEQVQGKPANVVDASPSSAPQNSSQAQKQQPASSSTPKGNPMKEKSSSASSKPKRMFPWKKQQSSASDASEEKKDDDGATPAAASADTDGISDLGSIATAAHQQSTRSQPRLQQFASEYARHLSRSSLAPPPTKPTTSKRFYGRGSAGSGANASNSNSNPPPPLPPTHQAQQTIAPAGLPSRSVAILEHADTSVLTGALLDLCVTFGEEAPPRGYHRITQTASGRAIPNYRSSGSSSNKNKPAWYLNVKKETNWDRAAQRPTITALTVIFPDRGEFVPPGFCVVKTPGKVPANLMEHRHSSGKSAERCYLVFRRSRECNPLTGIVPLVPPESVPAGYTVVEQTPRNHRANVNGEGGNTLPPIFLAYRQRLCHLEALRPLPLVRAAQPHSAGADFCDDESLSQYSATKLMAYYATGGTTVRANVGRFHILDRSTHSLLSPSSVANRLALIQISRKASISNTNINSSSSNLLDLDEAANGSTSGSLDNDDTNDLASAANRASAAGVLDYHRSSSTRKTEQVPVYILSHFLKSSLLSNDGGGGGGIEDSLMCHNDGPNLQKTLESMAFIPTVETAVSTNGNTFPWHLQARSALLTPLLTACYTRHGGAALVAVEALTSLLTETDFFKDDFDLETDDHESSRRLTLLDLSLQAVCDVATSSASEHLFVHCVDFVQPAVQFSEGKLNTRTIGYVVRFYLFVFYFGASVPSQSQQQRWPNPNWTFRIGSKKSLDEEDDEYNENALVEMDDCRLLDDPRTDGRGYLPGGAPQSAALALKELISLSVVRLGKVSVSGIAELVAESEEHDNDQGAEQQQQQQEPSMTSFFDLLVSGLIDDACSHVDRANYTQLAYYQIHRSGGSELFWHDMSNTCGMGLFKESEQLGAAGRDIYIMIFAVLANLVKVSSGKLRPNSSDRGTMLLHRDTASKLLSFELLLHFLEYWSDEQEAVWGAVTPPTLKNNDDGSVDGRSVATLAFSIRRMVVPSLLSNTLCALEDPQVFTRIIRIVSELWCSPVYRKHCKVELGILMEHFGLRMLQLGPQLLATKSLDLWSDPRAHVSLLAQQVQVIREIKNWFSNDPKDVIELFLNFDTDMCSELRGGIELLPGTQWKIFQRICAGLSNIAEQCGELIGRQIRDNQSKVLYNRAGAGLSEILESMNEKNSGVVVDETTLRKAARLLRKTSLETISQIIKSLALSSAASAGNSFASLLLSWSPVDAAPSFLQSVSNSMSSGSGSSSTKSTSEKRAKTPRTPVVGDDDVLRFWNDKIAEDQQERLSNAVPSSQETRQVALEIARRKCLKKAIEYLIACNALSPSPRDIANFLRINKDRLDPAALGTYLSEIGTGGAEADYWNSIRHFYVRAISFVGQTLEEGLRHFLTSCGFRLPGEAQMVDRIMTTFAKCYYEDNAGDLLRCPFKHEDTVYLLSFAIIMLNTDHGHAKTQHKKMTKTEFINNLRGAEQGEEIPREYLATLFDSIEANPIELHYESSDGSKSEEGASALQDMLNNVRTADSLLRGLAVHDFHFATIDDFVSGLDYNVQDALGDLTRSCVSKTWHQWHGVINTGLETAHLDPAGMEPSVDILLYALCLTVCLDMPTERAAFLSQLGRLKAFEERRQGRWVSAAEHDSYKEAEWYLEIEKACAGSEDRKLWALRTIREWMLSLKAALQVDSRNKISMSSIARQIKDGDFLLRDPARSFLRDGHLLKKSSRTGRSTSYRFFLFSDLLFYASQEPDGRYKIHEELPLHLLKVIDWFPPSQKNRNLLFEINHPRKSFFVICPSPKDRKSWVKDIKAAVTLEMDRKMKVEAARMAVYTR